MSAPILPFEPYLLMLCLVALFLWAICKDEIEKQKNKKAWKIAFYSFLVAFVLMGYSPIIIDCVKHWSSWIFYPMLGDAFILMILVSLTQEIKRMRLYELPFVLFAISLIFVLFLIGWYLV
jgi:Ca2+/Na+ antiporter